MGKTDLCLRMNLSDIGRRTVVSLGRRVLRGRNVLKDTRLRKPGKDDIKRLTIFRLADWMKQNREIVEQMDENALIEELTEKAQKCYSFYAPETWSRRTISENTAKIYAKHALQLFSGTRIDN